MTNRVDWQSIHHDAIIIDAHSDILGPLTDGLCRLADYNVVPPPRKWVNPYSTIRDRRATPYTLSDYALTFGATGQYDIPRFQSAGLTCQIVAIYVTDVYLPMVLERCLDMIATLHAELQTNQMTVKLVRKAEDIRQAKAEGKTGLLLSFEGMEPIGNRLDYLDLFCMLGLRMVGLSHSRRNMLADGTQVNTRTGGLSALGVQAVERLNNLGIVIDLAHLADAGFWHVLELSRDPVVVSHASVLTEYPGYRAPYLAVDPSHGKTKLQALAENGGVIGIAFWSQPNIQAIVREITTVIEHVGPDHVGLGSDFFSLDRAPVGLEDISKLPTLTEALADAGLDDHIIHKVLGGNFMRVFESVFGG